MNEFAQKLLAWYDQSHRKLPFRMDRDPYKIWISEIMAQQTRIEALLDHYDRFIQLYPDMKSLAEAPEDALMKAWQGLGYYNRARKLQAASRICMEKYDGRLPGTYEELLTLPGIGPYTAGAIASIAYNEKVPAVDGNVSRVFSRLFHITDSISAPAVQKKLRALVMESLPERTGDYNQALMELGALICIPRSPRCGDCPIQDSCQAYAYGDAASLPIKDSRKPRKTEKKHLLIHALDDGSAIRLVRRPDSGLLAGMYGFEEADLEEKEKKQYGLHATGKTMELDSWTHIFTHREWHMTATLILYHASTSVLVTDAAPSLDSAVWVSLEQAQQLAVPSAFQPFFRQAQACLKTLQDRTDTDREKNKNPWPEKIQADTD